MRTFYENIARAEYSILYTIYTTLLLILQRVSLSKLIVIWGKESLEGGKLKMIISRRMSIARLENTFKFNFSR